MRRSLGRELFNTPDLFVVSHSGARAGAPMVLLRFLDWLTANTTVDAEVMLLHGGAMEDEFRRFDAHIVGGAQSRLWMFQQGLTSMHFDKPAAALALARLGPPMWVQRNAPLMLMNSVGSLPALQFMPSGSPTKVVLYVHELDGSFERTLGARVWERLSPRVDHFISCSDQVSEMLVERKGVSPDRVTQQPGFINEQRIEPLRSRYLRRTMSIPPNALVVGASGRPEWRKAPEVFIRVARTMLNSRPDLNLHFVWLGGPIDDSPGWKMIHDVEGAGLAGRFHLTGETSQPGEIMNLFDLFALTSREEPYPLAMLEAASLGVPVVSFDNGGSVQFAAAGGDDPLAVIVPFLDVPAMSDAIIHLFDNPTERADLAARARAHVLATHLTDQAAPRLFETLADLQPGLRSKWHGQRRPITTSSTA